MEITLAMHQMSYGVNISNIWIPSHFANNLAVVLVIVVVVAAVVIRCVVDVCVVALLFQQFTLEIMCKYLINIIFSEITPHMFIQKIFKYLFYASKKQQQQLRHCQHFFTATTSTLEICLFIKLVDSTARCCCLLLVLLFLLLLCYFYCLAQVHNLHLSTATATAMANSSSHNNIKHYCHQCWQQQSQQKQQWRTIILEEIVEKYGKFLKFSHSGQ